MIAQLKKFTLGFFIPSLLTFLITLTAHADDQGYRFRNGACQNESNQKGFNPTFLGECGFIEGMSLQEQTLRIKSSFRGARMRRADLRKLNAEGATFFGADLTEANLAGAQIRDCDFSMASMNAIQLGFHANLDSCIFRGVTSEYADFSSANLRRADMSGTRLKGSNFRDAIFDFTDLTFADLRDTDLRGADLRFTDLFATQLGGSLFNSFTRLPFDAREAQQRGMILTP
jgi:uncharacterized protein YjbI with pentapeptide repeats